LWQRTAALAARVLLGFLTLWGILFALPVVFHAPTVDGSWEDFAETAVVFAASWVAYAECASAPPAQRIGFAGGASGLRIARWIYGLAMIQFGVAHFVYPDLTIPLVPNWLPWPAAWAYFTGGAYVAMGVAIVIDVKARLAAMLSAVQMGAFTALVWVPTLFASPTAFQQSEFVASWFLTACAWIVAASYFGGPQRDASRSLASR
jgi:uncharacterized membrane protein